MDDLGKLILNALDPYCNQFVLICRGKCSEGEGSVPIYFEANYKTAPAS